MKRAKFQISVVACSVCFIRLLAAPWSFDSASTEIKEFVVDSITGCVRTASIALLHRPTDALRENVRPMPWYFDFELRLSAYHCVEMLRGDVSAAGYKVCYLYDTPRRCFELPQLDVVFDEGPRAGQFRYFKDKKPVWGRGKELWRWIPPYDPYNTYEFEEFVMLMFVTPVKSLDMKRVRPRAHPWNNQTIVYHAGGDVRKMTSTELMRRLGIEHVFSNRVFRKNEGCAFQVDYPVPELEWINTLETREQHAAKVRGHRNGCQAIMHLSSDEVSEVVFLAYKVNGDDAGYEAACRRCPRILKPVAGFKTTIGRMVLQSLQQDGLCLSGEKVYPR